MSILNIKNDTGISNDTKVSIDNIEIQNLITDIDISPMKKDSLISVKLTVDMAFIDIETEDFVLNLVYGGKDICTKNCKGCESRIPSIQGCR